MEATYILILFVVSPVFSSFLEVNYPDVNVSAEHHGDVIFEAGVGGNVFLKPGSGGTVYVAGTDLKMFIEKVKSLPPFWTKQSEHATLGTFYSGENLRVKVEAMDPEGGTVLYSLISGHLPQGTQLDMKTGLITGQAPDVDATYTFGIRATDSHGKYADGVFSIDIRERDQCKSNPCTNGGTCTDDFGTFRCTCLSGFGGNQCQTTCVMNAFGVAASSKKIPNAQLSGHLTYSTYNPWEGRLGSSSGWVGNDNGSWLQVDLGVNKTVYAVAAQGYKSSTYYISAYTVSSSIDGNTFVYAQTGGSQIFSGSTNYDTVIKHVLDMKREARFLRFSPLRWHAGGHPGMRVEVYGC